MDFVKLNRSSTISFTMVSNLSPSKALLEARTFIEKHRLPECELDMNGFIAMIEPNTNLTQILNEYIDWVQHKMK